MCSISMSFLKNSQISQGKICTEVSFFKMLHAGGLQKYLQKRRRHRCFPVTFVKSLRASSLQVSCRCSHRRCSVQKGVLKKFPNTTGKLLCWSLFIIILDYKETATQVFSCEISEIFQMTYFEEHLRTTVSDTSKGIFPNIFAAKFMLKMLKVCATVLSIVYFPGHIQDIISCT